MDLIGTVKQRYGRAVVTGRYFTLVLRDSPVPAASPVTVKKKHGLLDIFKPQLLSVGKQIHAEVTAALTRRAEAREQSLSAELNRKAALQAVALKEWTAQTEKTRREYTRMVNKRLELARTENQARLTAVRRDWERAERREAEKKREQEALPREARPVSTREARRMMEGGLAENREAAQTAINQGMRKSVEHTLRRLRDETAYERMRNATRRQPP